MNSIRPTLMLLSRSCSTVLIASTSDWPWSSPSGHCCDWRDQLALLSITNSTFGLLTLLSSSTEKMSMSSGLAWNELNTRPNAARRVAQRDSLRVRMACLCLRTGSADVIGGDADRRALSDDGLGFGDEVGGDGD